MEGIQKMEPSCCSPSTGQQEQIETQNVQRGYKDNVWHPDDGPVVDVLLPSLEIFTTCLDTSFIPVMTSLLTLRFPEFWNRNRGPTWLNYFVVLYVQHLSLPKSYIIWLNLGFSRTVTITSKQFSLKQNNNLRKSFSYLLAAFPLKIWDDMLLFSSSVPPGHERGPSLFLALQTFYPLTAW